MGLAVSDKDQSTETFIFVYGRQEGKLYRDGVGNDTRTVELE